MKRKLLYVFAAVLALVFGSAALAATTVSDVQAIQQQVSAKIEALQGQTLTTAQKKKLTTIQNSFIKLTQSSTTTKPSATPKQDSAREAKITAFKATLSESQKTAFEAMMPSAPGGGAPPSDRTMPSGSPPPTPAAGEKPTGSPPPAPSGAPTMSDSDRQAMETKRTAFIATLSESQKKAYEELFQTPASGSGATAQQLSQGTIDLSTLTASKLSKLEKQLKSLLTQLNKIK